MRLQTEFRAEPINRDIAIFLGDLEPRAQSRRFAELAEIHIADAKAINVRALGREPRSKTFVDGRLNAPLISVRPDGTIHVEFELILDVLLFIARTLEQFSPVKSGRYRKSHNLFADGVQIDLDTPQLGKHLVIADEYIFVNNVPYARKIETGMSQQAPDGVYQATANLARRRFRNVVRIAFTYRTVFGGIAGTRRTQRATRYPAIIVRTDRA